MGFQQTDLPRNADGQPMAPAGFEVALLPARPYDARYTAQVPVVGFAFETQAGTHALGSDRETAFLRPPNSLALVPSDCDVRSASPSGGEYLVVRCTSFDTASLLGDRRKHHLFNTAVEPAAIAAARTLRRLIMRAAPTTPLDLEAPLYALCTATRSVIDKPRRDGAARWLTPNRLRRIDAFIDAHLEHDLTVAQISAMLGLSAGFFARAFKAAMGRTPHRYIMDRRLAQARHLLAETRIPLADVAYRCGFANQAHMTTVLGTALGVTPRAYRAARQGETQQEFPHSDSSHSCRRHPGRCHGTLS